MAGGSWLRFGRKLKGCGGREEPRAKPVGIVYFPTESGMGHVGNGDGRAEKPRYDVPQGVSVKNLYEAELTNQRRGSGSKI